MRLEKLGPYRLDRQLGQGGMGTVYAGVHEETGQSAAVKVLSSLLGTNKNFRIRFDAEIETLKKLKHPHIVQLYGYGEQDGHLFYAMELVAGHSLQDELRAGRQFTWRDVVRFGIEICAALKHAHDSGVIHRDLKPANLLLTAEGQVKLTDFGIAKLFGATQLTVDGGIVGTADYMSPEQAEGKPVTARCDLYSLGSVFYALLSRRPPFTGRSLPQVLHALRFDPPVPIRRLAPDTPAELEEIIARLLEKDPQDRIPTALVLGNRLKALEQLLSKYEPAQEPAAEPESGRDDGYQLADEAPGMPKTQPGITSPSQPTRVGAGAGDALANEALTWDELTQASAPREAASSRRTAVDGGLVSAASRFTTVSEEELRRAHTSVTVPETGLPLWLRTLAVVLVVVLLVAGLWYVAQPASADTLYQRISTAAQDGSVAKLKDVESEIGQFLARYPLDPRTDEVTGYRDEIAASRKSLTFELKTRRPSHAQMLSPAERAYFEATQLSTTDPEAAAVKLQALVDVFGGVAEESEETKRAVDLAQTQIEQLQKTLATQRPKHLAAIGARLDWAEQHRLEDAAAANAVCRGVIELYASRPWAAAAVARARSLLGGADHNVDDSP